MNGVGPLAARGGPSSGVRPEYHGPQLWVPAAPPGAGAAPQTLSERLDSSLHAGIERHNDSLAIGGSQRQPGDWTREIAGRKYGIDQELIHLGPLEIPTAVLGVLPLNVTGNPIAATNERLIDSRRADINLQATRALNDQEVQHAAADERLRNGGDGEEQQKQEARQPDPQDGDTPGIEAPTAQHGKGSLENRGVARSSLDSLVVPPPITKTGCATFDVQITGSADVIVTLAPGASCGPITPVVAGAPSLDPSRRIVHVPIALHNGGEVELHAPASVVADIEGIKTTAAAPSLRPDTVPTAVSPIAFSPRSPLPGMPDPVLHSVGADVQRDSGRRKPAQARWSYDTLLHVPTGAQLTASDGSIVLPPGATSMARSIDLVIPPGMTEVRFTLRGFGTYVLTVAARPPDTVPLDQLRDSRFPDNVITGDPRFPGRVVRNKLWLLFRPTATAEQRQAAIEAINGIIVGGTVFGTGNRYPPPSGPHTLRYYYVAFPAYPDSGAAPLARAIRTLAPLPQVQDVRPDVLGKH